MLNDTDTIKDIIHKTIVFPVVSDIFERLKAKIDSNKPPIINNNQFI